MDNVSRLPWWITLYWKDDDPKQYQFCSYSETMGGHVAHWNASKPEDAVSIRTYMAIDHTGVPVNRF